jgi:bacterial/archaeal transporter family-2 protein
MNLQVLFIALALCAGMMIPFQSAMNAQLGKTLQSPYFSALTVFVVAMIGLSAYIIVFRHTIPAVQSFKLPRRYFRCGLYFVDCDLCTKAGHWQCYRNGFGRTTSSGHVD